VEEEVTIFKDWPVNMKNLHNKIVTEIKELKATAKQIPKKNAYHLTIFAFIGHGVIN
jgi:hypothetical protein